VPAEVTRQIDQGAALGEVPPGVVAGERIVIPTAQDRLGRPCVDPVDDGERATRERRAGTFVDVDDQVGDDVLRAGRPVVEADAVVDAPNGVDISKPYGCCRERQTARSKSLATPLRSPASSSSAYACTSAVTASTPVSGVEHTRGHAIGDQPPVGRP